ncbi:MAG: hypothetical protein ABFS28_00680 [Bacteroidota bacterium]
MTWINQFVPIHADPESYVPDGYQLAKYIMHKKEYYIGYHSDMQIHGLVLQPPGLRAILPAYEHPKHIYTTPEIPRNSSMKMDRLAAQKFLPGH